MIKIVIITIILFIIFIILLLSFNIKIEYFSNTFISKTYTILRDNNNITINPEIWFKFDNVSNPHFNSGSGTNNWNSTNANINTNNNNFVKGSGSVLINSSTRITSTSGSLNISNKSFTISYWIKSPLTTNNHIFGRVGGTKFGSSPYIGQSLLLSTYSSPQFAFAFNYDDLFCSLSDTEFNSYKNVWTHLTYTFNTTNRRRDIYINGISRANDISLNQYIANNDGIYTFNYTGVNTDTYIDDFRIYYSCLTEEQVYELYYGYRRMGENIDNTSICTAYNAPSGIINQIPSTSINFTNISAITKINDVIYQRSIGNTSTTYTLNFSKPFNDDYVPTNLFLRNNNLTAFTIDNYDDNGNYIGILNTNNQLALSNFTEKGDFIHIRFPTTIILKRYGFKADNQWVSRAPGTWSLYAINNNTTNINNNNSIKTLLVSNQMRLNNNNYCNANLFTYIHDLNNNTLSCNELLFIFTSLASSTSVNNPGRLLSFMELLLFTT